jgi:ABC-type multidrug transport system fused ATPase/permease subunit
MENGKIVQDGNHQELMKQEGPYARLFRTQGSWYQE